MKSLIKSSFGFGSGKSKSNNNDKAADKVVDKNNNFQFDEASVSSYIDLLEEAVKHKTGPKIELGIQIVSGKSVTGVVDSFTSRTLKIDDLSQLNSNTLWSALVKILEISSPILSDANCTNLQTASARQVGGITKTLPLYNQQLLGALFATCEILIQNDQSCGHVLVNSLSDALIWSLSPGSSNCRESFCNLISNHREHLPYSQTFSVRLGADPKTFNLTVWLRIISTPDKPADNSAGRVEELDSQSVSSVGTTESQAKKKHGLIHGTGFKKALGLKKSDSGIQNTSGAAAASSTVATTSAAVDINDNASVSSLGTVGTTDSQAAKKKGLIRGTGFKAMMGLKKKKPEEVKAAGIALAPPLLTVGGADPQSGLDSARDRTTSDEVLKKQKSASNLLTDTSNNSNSTSNPKLAGLYKPDTASVYKSLDLHVIDNAHNTSERKEQENDHDQDDRENEFNEGTGRSSEKLPATSRGGKPPTPTKQSKSITNHPILSKSQTLQGGGGNNSSGSAAQYNNNSWITAAGASKKKASPSSSYDEDDQRKPKSNTSSNNITKQSWGNNKRNDRNDNHDSDSENSLQTDPGEEEEGKEEGKGSDIDGIPTLHSDNELDVDDEDEDNQAISLRDVQEVFSSSLVSSVSLEYLSLKTLREDEDYADIKNLSRNLKWTLDAIKLSQQVLDLEGTPEQRKGIVSWSDFLLVASPHLHSADRAFLKSNKIAYDQPYKRAGASGAGGDGGNNRSSAQLSKQVSKVTNNTSTASLGKQNSTNTFRNISRNESKTSDRGAQSDSDEDAFPFQANKDARSRFKAHNADNKAFSNSSVQYAGGDNDIDDSLDDIPMLSIAGKKPSNTNSNNNLTRSESKRGDDSGNGRFGNNQSAHTIGNDIMETFDSDSDQSADAKSGGKKPSAGGAGEESDLDDSFAAIGNKGAAGKSSQPQHKRKPTVKKWDARNSSDNDDAVDDSILSIPDISDSPASGRGAGGGLERPKVIAGSPERVMKGAPSFSNTRSVSFNNKNSYSNYNSTDLSKQLSRSLLTDDSDEQRESQDAIPSLNETNSWDEGDSEITDSNKIKSSHNNKKSISSNSPNDRSMDSIVSDRVEELSDNELEDDDTVDPNITELLGGKASVPISRNVGGSTLLRANSNSTGSSVPMTKRTPAPTNKPKSMFSLTEVDRSKDSIDSTQLSREEQEEEGAEVDGEREEDGKHNETDENEDQQQFSTISLDSPLPRTTSSYAAGLTNDTGSVTSTDSKTKKKGWGFKSALGLKKKPDAPAVTTASTTTRPAGPQRSASSNTVDDTASLAGSVGTAATTESQQAKKKHSGLFHGTGLKSALGLKKKKPEEATAPANNTATTTATVLGEVPTDKQQQPLQLQKDADNDNASVSSLGTAVTTDSQAAKKKHGLIHGTGFKAMMGLKKKKPGEVATPVSPSLNSLAQPVTPAGGVDQDAFDASSVADSIATTESQQIKKKQGLIRGTGLKSVLGLKKKKPEGADASPASAPTGGSNNAATHDVDETASVADSVGTAATTDSQAAKKKHGLIHGTGFKAMMGLKKKPEESTAASTTTTAAPATTVANVPTTPVESAPSKALPAPATSPQTTRGKVHKSEDNVRSSSSDPAAQKSATKSPADNNTSTAVSAPIASTSSPPRSRSAPAKSRPGESKSAAPDAPVPSATAGDGNAGDENASVADSVGTVATTDSQVAAKKKGLIRGTGLKKALGLKKKTEEVVAAPTGTAAVTSGQVASEKKDADIDNASVSSLGTAVTTDSQAKKKHGLIHGTGFKAMMGLKKKKPEEPEAPAAPSLNSLAHPVTPGGGNSSDVADETGSVADSVGTAATTDSQAKKKHGLIHGTGFKKAFGLKKKDPVDAAPTPSAQHPSTGAAAQSDDNASVAESVGSAGTTDSQAIKKYGLIHGTGFKKALGLKKKSDRPSSTGADDQSDTSSVADSVATTESQAKKKHGLIHGTGFKKALGLKKKDSSLGVDASPDLKIPPSITVDNSSNSSMPPPTSTTTPTNKLTNPALRKSTGGSGFGSSFGRALGRPGPASRSNSFSGTSGDEGSGGVALQGSAVNPTGKTSSGLSIVPPGSQMQDKTSPEYLAHRALPKTPVVTAARTTSNTSIVSTKGQVVPPSNGRGLAALLRGNVPAPLKPFSAAGHFTDSRPADRLDNVLGEVNILQETETAQHVRLRKALERNKLFSETIKQHNQKHHHHMKHKKSKAADSAMDDKTIDKNDRVAGFVSEMKSIQAHAHERQGLRTFASFEAKEDAASRAEWAALIQRREPENLFLSPADMQEMRDLVKLHGKKVVDSGVADGTGTDVAAADVVHSSINEHQKQKIQHKEPTPFEIMLSRQLSSTKVLQPDFSRQVFDPSSSAAGPGGVFIPPPIATHSKPLNTEFEMAMGIKHAGPLFKKASNSKTGKGYRTRYFVLIVEPKANPNLKWLLEEGSGNTVPGSGSAAPGSSSVAADAASGESKEAATTGKGSTTGGSDLHKQKSSKAVSASAEKSDLAASVSSLAVSTKHSTTTDKQQHKDNKQQHASNIASNAIAAQSALDPQELNYYLQEYKRSVPSLWGELPVALKRSYCLDNMIGIVTDSAKSKKGMKFRISFRLPENGSVGTGLGHPGGVRVMRGGLSAKDLDADADSSEEGESDSDDSEEEGDDSSVGASVGSSASCEADYEVLRVASEDTCDKDFDVLSLSTNGTTNKAIATAGAEANSSTKAKDDKNEKVADKVPGGGKSHKGGKTPKSPATVDTAKASTASKKEKKPHSATAGIADLNSAYSGLDSAPADHDTAPDHSPSSDITAATVAAAPDNTVLPPKINKRDKTMVHLKLRAQSSDERLQWVKILQSVAAHKEALYVNTISY